MVILGSFQSIVESEVFQHHTVVSRVYFLNLIGSARSVYLALLREVTAQTTYSTEYYLAFNNVLKSNT